MGKDFSPEERLLRLIRSKTPKQAPTAVKNDSVLEGPLAGLPVSVSSEPEPSKQNIYAGPGDIALVRKGGRRQKVLRLESLNLVLALLLIGVASYALPFFFRKQKQTIEYLEEKVIAKEKGEAPKTEEPKRPSFEYFVNQADSHNIFSPVLKEGAQAQEPVAQGPKLEDVKGQLSLLGVIGGDAPQVIIEDKKAQKTYFLNKGATFGDIEVGDIFDNKVILIYQGERFELIL